MRYGGVFEVLLILPFALLAIMPTTHACYAVGVIMALGGLVALVAGYWKGGLYVVMGVALFIFGLRIQKKDDDGESKAVDEAAHRFDHRERPLVGEDDQGRCNRDGTQ